jgi:hypothetical protein
MRGCRGRQPQSLDQALDVCFVQGNALDQLAMHLELDGRPACHWGLSRRSLPPWPAFAQSFSAARARSGRTGRAPRHGFRIEFGRLGIERQGLFRAPVVHRQLDDPSGPGQCAACITVCDPRAALRPSASLCAATPPPGETSQRARPCAARGGPLGGRPDRYQAASAAIGAKSHVYQRRRFRRRSAQRGSEGAAPGRSNLSSSVLTTP